MGDQPVVPDYDGATVNNVVPALLGQLERGPRLAARGRGRAATRSCCSSSTASAGTSSRSAWPSPRPWRAWRAGPSAPWPPARPPAPSPRSPPACRPGEHGIVGYRMVVDDSILNVLRWATPDGDARKVASRPSSIQSAAPFGGERPPVVTRAEFAHSGFTLAHLDQTRLTPYRMASTLVTEVRPPRSGPGSRSSTPTTRASTRSPTSTGWPTTTTPSCGPPTAWWPTCSRRCPPAPPWSSPRTTGRSTSATTSSPPPPTSCATCVCQSGEARFRWLHARSGPGRRPAGRRHRPPRRHRLGGQPGADRGRAVAREADPRGSRPAG